MNTCTDFLNLDAFYALFWTWGDSAHEFQSQDGFIVVCTFFMIFVQQSPGHLWLPGLGTEPGISCLWSNKTFYIVKLHMDSMSIIYVVPPQSWGDRSDTKHSQCLLLGGRQLNLLTIIPKPKGSGGARAATAQIGPANKRNETKRCLPVEASLRPGEAVPW